MDFLIHIDRELFLVINGFFSPVADNIMYWISHKYFWAPLYAVLLFMLWRLYRKEFWVLILLIVVLVTLTDQVSVVFFKDVFERLRPCHDPALDGLVRIVRNHCGGSYGFISSHATNAFGVAIFAGSLLSIKYKWALLLLIIWASIISYSRIYLGVHYPGDVIVGGMVGSLIGYLMILIFNLIKWRTQKTKID